MQPKSITTLVLIEYKVDKYCWLIVNLGIYRDEKSEDSYILILKRLTRKLDGTAWRLEGLQIAVVQGGVHAKIGDRVGMKI